MHRRRLFDIYRRNPIERCGWMLPPVIPSGRHFTERIPRINVPPGALPDFSWRPINSCTTRGRRSNRLRPAESAVKGRRYANDRLQR
jgi:hypothetical protein